MANKISYGLSKLYYAVATISAADGTATYGTPKAIPGAVEISLDKEGETYTKYADDIAYFVTAVNSGYSGSFTVTSLPESFWTEILGEEKDETTGVRVEKASAISAHFALLFRFKGDESDTDYVLYNCVAERPSIASATKEDTIEAQDISVDITANTIYNSKIEDDIVKASGSGVNTWYTTVYQPA